jgi:hypothetical protein
MIQSTGLDIGIQPNAWINSGSQWQAASAYYNPPNPITDSLGRDAGMRLIDVNGDGLLDLVQNSALENSGSPGSWINTGSKWASMGGYTPKNVVTDALGRDTSMRPVDLNGDGLLDMIQQTALSGGFQRAWLNQNSGWQPSTALVPKQPMTDDLGRDAGSRLLDLNGDGLLDIIQSTGIDSIPNPGAWFNNNAQGWVNAPSTLLPPYDITDAKGRDLGMRLVDLNGDGLMDMIQSTGISSSYSGAWINTGSSWISAGSGFIPPQNITDSLGRDAGMRLVDLNGDDLLDIVQSTSISTFVTGAWINNGTGWQAVSGFNFTNGITDDQGRDLGTRFLDLNGDGSSDIIQQSGIDVSPTPSGAWMNQLGKSDLLVSFTGSLADTTQIEYQPMTNSAVYTKGQGAVYPVNDVQSAAYVVSQTSSDNGLGGQHVTNYRYAGARQELTGFGFLGYETVTTTDVSTGITQTKRFSQDYINHWEHLPVNKLTSTSNGTLLGNITNWWTTLLTGNVTL